jgi:hypothetical protein
MRQLCGTVLIMEAIILGLAIPVAIAAEHANRPLAGGVGGGLALCALLLSGVVGRPRMGWALKAGTVLQVAVIAAGIVVPAMYVLGVIFAALWVTGIWLARRHEVPGPVTQHPGSSAELVSPGARRSGHARLAGTVGEPAGKHTTNSTNWGRCATPKQWRCARSWVSWQK